MTTMTVRPAEDVATPESQQVELLREHLNDPACSGWHDAIREEIHRLTAAAALEA